jgi:hypothetical protein
MKRIANFYVLGALAMSLFLAGVANAANPPSECVGGRKEMFFNMGVIKGASLVSQTWNGLGDDPCRADAVDEFVDIVTDAFQAGAPPAGSPDTVLCHYAGTFAGALEKANELVNTCTELCCAEGEMIGEMAAIFYCLLSIDADGLGLDEWLVDIDMTLCGDLFSECCEERFAEYTQVYPSEDEPLCLPYTTYYDPPYDSDVYEQAQKNQCVYAVELP